MTVSAEHGAVPVKDARPRDDGTRPLYRDDRYEVGTFDCRPGSALWAEDRHVSDGYVVVYPAAPVLLTAGGRQIVADRTRAILHNDGEIYSRRLMAAEDDACLYIRLGRAEAVRQVERVDPAAVGPPRRELPVPYGHIDHATYTQQRLLRHDLESGTPAAPVTPRIEALLQRTVETALHCRPEARRPAPTRSQVATAEQVRLAVAAPLGARRTLAQVAERVGYSPFHLARVFRAVTGMTIQDYRNRLRLRAAVDRLVAGERNLSALAGDLGFATHSHFTDRFHSAFGTTPAEFRRTRVLPPPLY